MLHRIFPYTSRRAARLGLKLSLLRRLTLQMRFTSGEWRSTLTLALAVMLASWPVRRRIIFRLLAKVRLRWVAKCTGFAWIVISHLKSIRSSMVMSTIPKRIRSGLLKIPSQSLNLFPAFNAKWLLARLFVQ